jgi:hypothetical protein
VGGATTELVAQEIQGSVLRLRRTLGATVFETTQSGCRLMVAAEELDSSSVITQGTLGWSHRR